MILFRCFLLKFPMYFKTQILPQGTSRENGAVCHSLGDIWLAPLDMAKIKSLATLQHYAKFPTPLLMCGGSPQALHKEINNPPPTIKSPPIIMETLGF